MKTVAITGVSGYVGGVVSRRLGAFDGVERIIGIDRREPGPDPPKLKFYKKDILQPFGDIFAENQVDTAIHLAFVVKPSLNHKLTQEIDVKGTLNFLDACRMARVKHVICLSSHTVYGAHPDNETPLTEDSKCRPMPGFQYSWDKSQAEKLFQQYARGEGTRLSILRSCPILGPNAAGSVATGMFKPPVMVRIRGYDPPLQFVHEDDIADIISFFVMKEKVGVFNVAGEGEIRYSEVPNLCGKRIMSFPEKLVRPLMGFSWKLHLQSDSPPDGLDFIKYPPVLDTGKVKAEGFQFRYSCKEALESYTSSLLPHRQGPESIDS